MPSGIEQKVQHIAVLHFIGLALDPEAAGLFGTRLAVPGHIIVVADRLCPDETFLEIAVDHPGGGGGQRSLPDRPGAKASCGSP